MVARADGMREAAERVALAVIGAVALTGERADELAEKLAERGSIGREEARDAIDELSARWRGEALRLGERTGSTLEGVFRQLNLVTKREAEELELRLAQLEHRLRLLEGLSAEVPAHPPSAPAMQ